MFLWAKNMERKYLTTKDLSQADLLIHRFGNTSNFNASIEIAADGFIIEVIPDSDLEEKTLNNIYDIGVDLTIGLFSGLSTSIEE